MLHKGRKWDTEEDKKKQIKGYKREGKRDKKHDQTI